MDFNFGEYMIVENYELILVKGVPKALTLDHKDCEGFERFVSLEPSSSGLVLRDTSGKTLSLTAPQTPLPLGAELSVFALFSNGQTASQSVVFVE